MNYMLHIPISYIHATCNHVIHYNTYIFQCKLKIEPTQDKKQQHCKLNCYITIKCESQIYRTKVL